MLKSTFRTVNLCARGFYPFFSKNYALLNMKSMFLFSQKNEEGTNPHEEKQKHTKKHHEYYERERHDEHVHGPGCSHGHNHDHHTHQQGHRHRHDHGRVEPNQQTAELAKLNKMTFEELIELKTEESIKFAEKIYEKEEKRLKKLGEEKEQLNKNLSFYDKIEEEIKQKEVKLAENIKLYQQESELSKKRAEKQIQESKNFGVTKIAKQLLQVADCISSCRKFAEQSEVKDEYITDVVRSQELIKSILQQFNIEQFDPINTEYDPNSQESLLNIPTPPGFKTNHVAMTMRTGYTIKGRLLRSARVGVFC